MKYKICGKSHKHGAGRFEENPRDYLGHRASHCTTGREGYIGYWLKEDKTK